MKVVAQYSAAAGWVNVLISVRPGRDDRWVLALTEVHANQRPSGSIVPGGTDVSFCTVSQHFVLGYFHCLPPGLNSPALDYLSPPVRALLC